MATKAPLAFILVKFRGSNDEPLSKKDAELMFTDSGRGTMKVVDWFDDNSHGQVDMSGNQVFGWLTLNETVDQYRKKRADGTYGRTSIIDLGRAAAVQARVDLAKFVAVVIVTNIEVDLFGGSGFACCTAARAGKQFWEIQTAPSVLCQEIIHGLGIADHSRRHGTDVDYRDPYDVMSMFLADPGHHPNDNNLPVGPGLNAAFMQRCGWLDQSRGATPGLVQLRPLHRRDLPGPLYATVGIYFVEYRASDRWDSGFPPVVLVHYIAKNTSYLIAELQAGSEFKFGDPFNPFEPHGSINVDAIDQPSFTATITTSYSPGRTVPVAGPATSLFGTEFGDGGGFVIVGDHIVRIPPRSPELELVKSAAAIANIGAIEVAPFHKHAMLVEVLARAKAEIGEAYEHLTGPSSPQDHIGAKEALEFHRGKSKMLRGLTRSKKTLKRKTRRRARP